MNTTQNQLNARRSWLVPSVSVTGDLSAETVNAIATEVDDGATRVVFYHFTSGGHTQTIAFATLTDHRGNALPATIARPVVIPIQRGAVGVAVVGTPTNWNVRLARTDSLSDHALVDLWIIEAGE